MENTVAFPGLGLEFTLPRTAFTIFGLEVQWYGVIIAAGFVLALLYGLWRAKGLGLDADRVIDVAIGGLIGGIIGARLYYVIFSWNEFSYDLVSIFRIWDGGLAIYGGIIGGVLVGSLVAKWRKVKLLPMFDMAGMGFLIGQGIGRWGNFFNVEAFGCNTTLPWGMTSERIQDYLTAHASRLESIGMTVDPTQPVHPTFLYESIWCLLGFLLLHFYFKHRRFDGEIGLMYLAWYGLGRSVIEGLRTDPLTIGTIRVSQLLAVLLVIASVITWIIVRLKIRGAHDPNYLPLYVTTEESKQLLAQAEEQRKKSKMRTKKAKVSEDAPLTESEHILASDPETQAEKDAANGQEPQESTDQEPAEQKAAPAEDSVKAEDSPKDTKQNTDNGKEEA